MTSNLDRFRTDLEALIERGILLLNALQAEHHSDAFDKALVDEFKTRAKAKAYRSKLPRFRQSYQSWYSEALAVVKQLLPDRLADFIRHYEKPKGRKDISFENYRIEDALQGLHITRGWNKENVVGPEAAINQFEQQLGILTAARKRFESSLFDIRQLVQADLFDSEIDAARALAKQGFFRSSGALAGVVLEKHLAQVCANHAVSPSKKNPTIADLNDALKKIDAIDTPQWRRIQHLGDLRNLCDHDKQREPTDDEAAELIEGVSKVTKVLF
jgi:hypothetical protein